MRKVAQLIDSPINGDCFRACVASILELDPLVLPNVTDPEYSEMYHVRVMNNALQDLGIPLVIAQFSNGQAFWSEPSIMIWSVSSPRYEDKTHAVVVTSDGQDADPHTILGGWRVAWDPSPWRDTDIERRYECYRHPVGSYLFIARHPERIVPRC